MAYNYVKIDDKPIAMIRAYCQKVLPAVYDDSLSFYQLVCKIQAKLNEVIEKLNLIDLSVFATKDELEQAIAELDSTLRELLEQSQAEQTVMLKAWALAKLKELEDYLQGQIDNAHISDVMVIDPEESVPRKSLQNTLYSMNQNYRTFADCAKNLDAKEYTVSAIAALGLTAYMFDFSSTFYYSKGMSEVDGIWDGNYMLSMLYSLIGAGGSVDMESYVKKHDIMSYYFDQKE